MFASAPADIRSPISMTMLYQFAAAYAMRKPVALNVRLSRKKPRDVLELSDLCIKHNTLDLYLWLSIRFPAFFVEQDVCIEQKAFAIDCIQGSLESPHLQHKFSHSNSYQTARIKMLTGHTLGLPSLSYGAVRESYLKNMESIDDADIYTFPTVNEESLVMGLGNKPFTRDPNSPRKVRDDVESRTASLPIGLRGGPPTTPYVDRSKENTRIYSSTTSSNRNPSNPAAADNRTAKDTVRQEKVVVAIPFRSSANVVVDKNGKKVYRVAGQAQQPNHLHDRKKNYNPSASPGMLERNHKFLRPVGSHLKSKLASEINSS